MAIVFDGVNKRIVLDRTSISASEIWSAWVIWHKENPQWDLAFKQVGGDSLGGGLYIPPYLFLQGSWRVRPMEQNHQLVITGNLFTMDGSSPIVNTLGNFNVSTQLTVPVQAQAMSTSGGSGGLTSTEHNHLMSLDTLLLRKILTNNKEIKDNQLVIFDDDKVTPLFTWHLKNKLGQPSETQVFKSELV